MHRIKSQSVLRDAITRPIVRENTKWFAGYDGDVQKAREDLEEDWLSVSMIRTTTLIHLGVTVPFEDDPPRILNSIIDVYLGTLRLEAEAQDRGVRKVFLQEREQSEERIRQLNEDIRNFTEEEDIETLDEDKSVAAMDVSAGDQVGKHRRLDRRGLDDVLPLEDTNEVGRHADGGEGGRRHESPR